MTVLILYGILFCHYYWVGCLNMRYRFKQNTSTSKYKNKKTVVDGFNFSSQLEAKYYMLLTNMKRQGIINIFLMQVPFHISPGVTYRADFQVFYSDGLVEFIDVKGFETELFKVKKKLVEDKFGIEIKVIKKSNIRGL